MNQSLRHWVGTLVLIPVLFSAMYSANTFGLRDRFPPPATMLPELGRGAGAKQIGGSGGVRVLEQPVARSHPWWKHVGEFAGDGDEQTEVFSISSRAIQWKVAWECERGPFSFHARRPSGQRLPRDLLAGASCPGQGEAFSVKTGSFALAVEAAGPWKLTLQQQVDIPLVEAQLPGMSALGAEVIRSGSFYDVDRVGRGTAKIFRLPGGQMAIRLDEFFVSQNSDLELWLSELPRPKTTPEIAAAPVRKLEFLRATTGSMNYLIPDDVDISRYRSLIIWCELTHNAYAAAALN